jgi:hypothetical protein
MMKILLSVSVVLNLVLGFFLFSRKPEVVERERLIIETHAQPVKQESEVSTKAAAPQPLNKEEKKKSDAPEFTGLDNHEFQEAGEKMESDRMEFMTETLGMSEDKIAKHNKLREEFFKNTAAFWQKNPMRELSFKERRQMIEMEEKFYAQLEKLHGKKNWEKYQKFREDYNSRGYKKQMEDGQPFLFMGL